MDEEVIIEYNFDHSLFSRGLVSFIFEISIYAEDDEKTSPFMTVETGNISFNMSNP
jgi:hypothetical protein